MMIMFCSVSRDEMQEFIEDMKLPLSSVARVHTVGGRRNSAAKTDLYFSQLTRAQVQALYQIYKYDFILYNYDINHYLDIIK